MTPAATNAPGTPPSPAPPDPHPGKPKPLRYLGPVVWSRRITQEHRVVYLVRHDHIDFL